MGIAHLMLGNVARTGSGKPRIRDIHIEASPTIDSLIYYSYIENNSILVIDAQVNGITCSQLLERMTISAYNGSATFSIKTNTMQSTTPNSLVATGYHLCIQVSNPSHGTIEYIYPIAIVGDLGTPTYEAEGTSYRIVSCSGVGDGKSLYKNSDHRSPDKEDDAMTMMMHYSYYGYEFGPIEYVAAKGLTRTSGNDPIGSNEKFRLQQKNFDLATYLQQYTTSSCEHEGGTATCVALAVCTKCGESYGEFANHVYPTVTSDNIQWVGSSGTCCDSARLVVNCSVCGGATISEYGSLSHNHYEDTSNETECYGSEDCEATFEHEVFQSVNPASCPYWHNKVHQGYRETDMRGGSNCQDQIIVTMTCQCDDESYDRYTGEYGPHNSQLISSTTGIDCKTAGLDTYECSICHMKESEDNTNYGPHNWEDTDPSEYDCTERIGTKVCVKCGIFGGDDTWGTKHEMYKNAITECSYRMECENCSTFEDAEVQFEHSFVSQGGKEICLVCGLSRVE